MLLLTYNTARKMASNNQSNKNNEAQAPPRRKKGVRPSTLAQFFDTPQQSSPQRSQRGGSSRPTGLGGTSKRASLTDKRQLSTPEEYGSLGGAFDRADFKNDVYLPRTEAQNILHRAVDDRADDEIYVVVPEHYTIAGVVPLAWMVRNR